jgi:monooxygenase
MIIEGVRQAVGPGCDVEKHFTPNYKPWDQRLCLVPNADLFKAIRKGLASVVTDQIECFTASGIKLRSGQELPADLIVTATGLDLLALGGIALQVDGKAIVMNQTMSYKGMMLAGVPNLAYVIGYTNASWTLKADLTSEYLCRLLKRMAKQGFKQGRPRLSDPSVQAESWIDFSSGYIQRSLDKFPTQGNKKPWRLHQNYVLDLVTLRFGAVDDGVMIFSKGT